MYMYLDARGEEDALGAALHVGALAGAVGATAAPSPERLPFASWLAWVVLLEAHLLRRRPRCRCPRLRLRDGHDKAEDGGAAGCWRRPTTTQGANGWPDRCAAHTMMASIHSL